MSRQTIKSVLEFAEAVAQAKSMPSQDEEWEMVLGIFDAHISIGQCYVPETFNSKVQKWFGKIDDNSSEEAVLRVEKQTVGKSCSFTSIITSQSKLPKSS